MITRFVNYGGCLYRKPGKFFFEKFSSSPESEYYHSGQYACVIVILWSTLFRGGTGNQGPKRTEYPPH